MLPEAELNELGESIVRSGQREKIILIGDEVLDGRNREAACELFKLTPQYRQYDPTIDGPSPLQFVLDKNLNRRQLTASQRAAAASEAFRLYEDEAKQRQAEAGGTKAPGNVVSITDGAGGTGTPSTTETPQTPKEKKAAAAAAKKAAKGGTARDAAGRSFGVSGKSVAGANELKKLDKAKFDEVKAGKTTLNKALGEARHAAEIKKRKETMEMVEANHGKTFTAAVIEGTILKTGAEIDAFMKLTIPQQTKILPMISKGWTVKKSMTYAFDELTPDSKVSDLINKALANGGTFTQVVNGFEIQIHKVAEA